MRLICLTPLLSLMLCRGVQTALRLSCGVAAAVNRVWILQGVKREHCLLQLSGSTRFISLLLQEPYHGLHRRNPSAAVPLLWGLLLSSSGSSAGCIE